MKVKHAKLMRALQAMRNCEHKRSRVMLTLKTLVAGELTLKEMGEMLGLEFDEDHLANQPEYNLVRSIITPLIEREILVVSHSEQRKMLKHGKWVPFERHFYVVNPELLDGQKGR
jgi:4-aminobutyrate aminotransferase-like enzyme